jgi:hypothetical protein
MAADARLRELAEGYRSETGSTPKCYIGGPMRGIPNFNFPEFERAARELRAAGWHVYSPRENDAEKGSEPSADGSPVEDIPLKYFFREDLWQVCDSDAIFLLNGWEKSMGATLERHVADKVGVQVYEEATGALIPNQFAEAPPLDFGPEFKGVDPETGGTKGRREATFANMSIVADVYEARVHGFGVMKYPDEEGQPNWSRGMPWSWFYDALRRHIAAAWMGEWINPESGLPHLAHARWMISNLIEYHEYGLGTDDRPKWRTK